MTPEKEIFYFLNGLVFVMHKLMVLVDGGYLAVGFVMVVKWQRK